MFSEQSTWHKVVITRVPQTKCSDSRAVRQFDEVLCDDGLLSAEYFGMERNLLKKEYIYTYISYFITIYGLTIPIPYKHQRYRNSN